MNEILVTLLLLYSRLEQLKSSLKNTDIRYREYVHKEIISLSKDIDCLQQAKKILEELYE